MNKDFFNKKNILALITALISILVGLIYLALVFALDFRGPMSPPPSAVSYTHLTLPTKA